MMVKIARAFGVKVPHGFIDTRAFSVTVISMELGVKINKPLKMYDHRRVNGVLLHILGEL